ncbi:hypothetical protein LCGC14_1931070 [marine sediment metagenome]|uniref:Uncharacterized protein n=1 Tax=marine sediment metagenome TaxID=412755 RepID=A0A0F9IKR7_9ZZZZ
MPSGGYGINQEDLEKIDKAFNDDAVRNYGMQFEWVVAYVSARVAGATPSEASYAAYIEWDL